MNCIWHLCKRQLTGRQRRFCSTQCKSKYFATANRRKSKLKAVAYKGGKCEVCGYSKCIGALDFHHRNEKEKEFGIAQYGHSRSWERVRKELDKCILVCCRCHREIHAGLIEV